MKKSTLLFYLFLAFAFCSCGSISDYSNSSLNKSYFQGKTIYFKLDPNSAKEVQMSGLYTSTIFDDNYPPNIENIFKESLQELSTETKINLQFVNYNDALSPDAILVNVDIESITWHFGFSTATLKSHILYKIKNGDRSFEIEGIRKSGGGSKINNVRKSIKNGNYKFLKELEK